MSFFSKLAANAQRVALSALKAGAAASVAYAVANQAALTGGDVDQLKGLGFAALVAGLDAALKIVQVALEKTQEPPAPPAA